MVEIGESVGVDNHFYVSQHCMLNRVLSGFTLYSKVDMASFGNDLELYSFRLRAPL